MSDFRDKPACSTKYNLFPVMITCERCGHDMETWPDEDEAVCSKCGDRIKVTAKG